MRHAAGGVEMRVIQLIPYLLNGYNANGSVLFHLFMTEATRYNRVRQVVVDEVYIG